MMLADQIPAMAPRRFTRFAALALVVSCIGFPTAVAAHLAGGSEVGLTAARALSKHHASLRQRVALVVAEGRVALPELTAEVDAGRADRLVVTSLGYLATPADTAILDRLQSLAFPRTGNTGRRDAIEALLRIGGAAIDRVSAGLADADVDPRTASVAFELLWQVPAREDLELALRATEGIARQHPDSRIRTQAREAGVPRLRSALMVRRSPQATASRALLEKLLFQQESAFVTVAGGQVEVWAVEQLARHHRDEAPRAIRSFLAERSGRAEGLQVLLLSTLRDLEVELSPDETKLLEKHHEIDFLPLGLDASPQALSRTSLVAAPER
ncbi:MAG: hypothetical protein AAF604_23620 [Acidobacteriota bacterium]